MRMSVPAPRSLSVTTILQLGKLVKANTTLVKLYSFNIQSLTWSTMPVPVEFEIGHDVFGEGSFRKAYKATTSTKIICRENLDHQFVLQVPKFGAIER